MELKFRIHNRDIYYSRFVTFITSMVFVVIIPGIALKISAYTQLVACILVIISFLSAILVPYLLFKKMEREIYYDGIIIKVISTSKEKVFFVEDIDIIKYDVDSSFHGYINDYGYVYVTFVLLSGESIELIAQTPTEAVNKLIKGDRKDVPIIAMYDDIVYRYPEKEEKGEGIL